MDKRLLVIVVFAAFASGCATTPKNPYAEETARVAATTAVAPASASMYIAPAVAIQSTPVWYMKPPVATASEIYVAGTGLSKDLGMSQEKAMLNAQSRLVDRLAAEVSKMTKQYSRESGENFNQNTEMMIKKVAADVSVAGYSVVDSSLWSEGGGYRTYVLLKYPLTGQARNTLGLLSSQTAAEKELKDSVKESHTRNAIVAPAQAAPEPAAEVSPLGLRSDPVEVSPLGLRDPKEED